MTESLLYTRETISPETTMQVCSEMFETIRHNPISVLLLIGDPGAGKTTFCRGFRAAMEIADIINSPTFNLHNRYPGKRGTLHHYDLYRLGSPEELEALGFAEEWSAVDTEPTVHAIEWGLRALPFLPAGIPIYSVELRADERDDNKRLIEIYTRSGQIVPGP